MSETEKTSIFNPKDKLSERDKKIIYLEYVPPNLKSIVKKHKCKYDVDNHKWYTEDEKSELISYFSKRRIDFWELMNEIGVQYDRETLSWYTYNENDSLKKYFND